MVGTLTMNHMTITKMYTLEHDDILDVEKSIDTITSLPTESALKRVLRIGTPPSNPPFPRTAANLRKPLQQRPHRRIQQTRRPSHRRSLNRHPPLPAPPRPPSHAHPSRRNSLLLRQKMDGRHLQTHFLPPLPRRRMVHQGRSRRNSRPLRYIPLKSFNNRSRRENTTADFSCNTNHGGRRSPRLGTGFWRGRTRVFRWSQGTYVCRVSGHDGPSSARCNTIYTTSVTGWSTSHDDYGGFSYHGSFHCT
jgi:hypothetical protein